MEKNITRRFKNILRYNKNIAFGCTLIFFVYLFLASSIFVFHTYKNYIRRKSTDIQNHRKIWYNYIEDCKSRHYDKVTGYAWWTPLAEAVDRLDFVFLEKNIYHDQSLKIYDCFAIYNEKIMLYGRIDQKLNFKTPLQVEDATFISEMINTQKSLLNTIMIYKGSVRLVTISPLCNEAGEQISSGYMLFATNLTTIIENLNSLLLTRYELKPLTESLLNDNSDCKIMVFDKYAIVVKENVDLFNTYIKTIWNFIFLNFIFGFIASIVIYSNLMKYVYRIEKERRKFIELYDFMPHIYAIIDQDLNVEKINKSAEKILGYKSDEIIGHNALLVYPESSMKKATQFFQSILQSTPGNIFSCELEKKAKDGNILNISEQALLRLDSCNRKKIWIVCQDITEKKKTENILFRMQNEENLAAMLRSMNHELRSPLQGLMGLSEFLIDYSTIKDSDERDIYSKHILSAGKHIEECTAYMSQVLKNISALAKQSRDIKLYSVDSTRVFVQVIANIYNIRKEEGIKIDFKSIVRHSARIKVSPSSLQQIFLNIINNAEEHGKAVNVKVFTQGCYGKIGCYTKFNDLDKFGTCSKCQNHVDSDIHKDPYLRICISDDGVGIPPNILESIFRPFYTTRALGGQLEGGLGLAIVERLMGIMDGKVEVYSREGVGTTFVLCFKKVGDDDNLPLWETTGDIVKEDEDAANEKF